MIQETGSAAGAGQSRPVAFLFPGVGDHYPGMGWGLYEAEPVFRRGIDECAAILDDQGRGDLLEVLYPQARRAEFTQERREIDLRRMLEPRQAEASSDSLLSRPTAAHAAIFAVEYALSRWWWAVGVTPRCMIGHSLGELTAACVAGVFDLQGALRLVVQRAALIESIPAGAMLAVPLSEQELAPLLIEGATIAATNAPQLTVVSGSPAAITELENNLQQRGMVSRRIVTTTAAHSAAMRAAADQLTSEVRVQCPRPPKIPFVSNLTGRWISENEATDPGYWARHLCEPVRFLDGMQQMLELPDLALVEIGPGQTLSSFARQVAPQVVRANGCVASIRSEYNRQPDQAFLLESLEQLRDFGVEVDGAAFAARGSCVGVAANGRTVR